MTLWLDFESKSACDLKIAGVYNYAQDISTEVLCMSFAFDDEPVQTWTPFCTDATGCVQKNPFPVQVAHFTGQIRAHNAAFERLIFWYVLQIEFKLEQFYCTATQARANCAPGSLEDVGRFFGAPMRKDHRGAHLVRQCCIPPYNQTLLPELYAYCEQDVRAMRAISTGLRQLTDEELIDYHVNERINDRGVLVDVPLARSAVQYAAQEVKDIQEIVVEVTGGAVPTVRSPKMREWVFERLDEEGQELMMVEGKKSIDKTVRANLLNTDLESDVREVIQSADDLWASSVAKFQRMVDLADIEDSRVRGAFVFAGGSATGRASSYGLQVHNFGRKCHKDPEAVRAAVVAGQSVVPEFGVRTTDVLKNMLRPALRGPFTVADWSAIEARLTPWLSGDGEEVLDVFRKGGDIYVNEAMKMFKVREVTPEQRQIGKVAILACFGQQTQVFTNNGLKSIVEVQSTDLLWDGQSWVAHQGLISKGLRQTINMCGAEVTPEHLIRTQQTWRSANQLVSNKRLLIQALEFGSANLPYSALKFTSKAHVGCGLYTFNVPAALRRILSICTTFSKAHLRGALRARKKRRVFIEKIISSTLTLAQTTRIGGDYLTACRRARTDVTTQKTAVTRIMEGVASRCTSLGALIKLHFSTTFLRWTGGISLTLNWIASTWTKDTNQTIFGLSLAKKMCEIGDVFRKCSSESSSLRPVFDILNSGPRNQFTILTDAGALIVHNCGFGGGHNAFAAMGRVYNVKLTETEARQTVEAWRRANPWAVRYWSDLEWAYNAAMRNPGEHIKIARVTYCYNGQHLWYSLPSGRILCYPFAKIEEDGITYAKAAWKPAQDAKEWPRARLWKGLACENITQACANDLLRHALRQINNVVLHVHDEIVVEGDCPELERIMCTPPAWAAGLPLKAEVKTMQRYGK